ncbi:MAG: hypothetical protein A2142_02125 [candidate division Zixibacteria bacterium RBG_16_48_11]|nr:MAG: hypothetical protein A2142_02125 [candidate division Zixibacteria bacterium RBG_16_48_11]
MKKLAVLTLLSVLVLTSTSYALKGIGIGVRAGYLSGYDNPDVPNYTGSLDKLPMLGAHLQFGFIPVLDVEVSGEYAWQTERNFIPGVDLTFGDLSVNGTVTYGFSTPVLKPYLGAGVGLHRLVYSWDGAYSGILPDDQTKMSWHGLGGVSLGFPALPFQVFVQARYTSLQTDPEKTTFTSLLGGVTFGF